MNRKRLLKTLGGVLCVLALSMLFPFFVALVYHEWSDARAFLISVAILLAVGVPLFRMPIANTFFFERDGMVTVGLSWILISAAGSLPFIISGTIPSFINAFFETTAGFTTAGATILKEIESLPYSMLFWRSQMNWMGGMGILIFMLSVLPAIGGQTLFIFRAEVTGTTPSKLTPRLAVSTAWLYSIYSGLTLVLVILLRIFGMSWFDAVIHAFGVAGTGGFSNKNQNIAAYNSIAIETAIAIFLLLFSINFALYYRLFMKQLGYIRNNSELRTFFMVFAAGVFLITINLRSYYGSLHNAFRYASFQMASMMSSSGFASADYNTWPTLSKAILALVSIVGSCSGSTGGGLKIERMVILVQSVKQEFQKILHPNSVDVIKRDGKRLSQDEVHRVLVYFITMVGLVGVSFILISLDKFDLESDISAAVMTVSNLGNGFGSVGPMGSFADHSVLSKIVLIFNMLAGRLEIYPILLIFAPSMWKGSRAAHEGKMTDPRKKRGRFH